MNTGIACIIVFAIMAALMYTRRISALLALPIMAVAIAIAGNIAPDRILSEVISKGAVKLHNTYTTTIFGAILAELINKLGIAKALVRWVAEFAGDNPYLLGLSLTLVTALLFSSLGGLGAVIMVGTIILPVMLSLGISAITAGSLFILGISLGGMFNFSNWQFYIEVLKIDQPIIASFVMPYATILAFIVMVFLAVELRNLGNVKYLGAGALILGGLFFGISQMQNSAAANVAAKPVADPTSIYVFAATLLILAGYAIYRHKVKDRTLQGVAFFTPIVPIILVLAAHWDFIPAFCAGIVFAVLITWQRDSVNVLTRAIIEGAASVMPAVILMIGIGMLMNAVMDPAVSGQVGPMLTKVVPTHAVLYVATFTVLAPLALYRGPLSLWGMGTGIVKLIQTSTQLSAPAIMAMLMSTGQLQGVCDPTNTQNVWVATYLGTDTITILKRTIPYVWAAVFCGLVLAVMFKFVPW